MTIDITTATALTAIAYVVGGAMGYAISKKLNTPVEIPTPAPTEEPTPFVPAPHPATEQFTRLYKKGLSTAEVAAKTGYSQPTVYRVLKAAGVEMRPIGRYPKKR